MKFGIKSATLPKKNLTATLNEKYIKTKIKHIMEKSIQVSIMIKYQKKVPNIFAYQ